MEATRSQIVQLRQFMASRRYVSGRAELIQQGFTPSMTKNWLRSGRLIVVFHGVYTYGRDIETRDAAWRAALVAAGPGSFLIGRSACEAWGVIQTQQKIPGTVEVGSGHRKSIVHTGLSPALQGCRVKVASRSPEPGDIRMRNGLKVTRVALALVDLAVNASASDVRFAFLEACRLGLFNHRDVAFCFRRVAGRRGAKKLRPLLAMWVPELARIKSVLEGLFLLAWVERRLEMPQVNVRVCGFEVDDYWPKHRLIVELDGAAFHSDPMSKAQDRKKERILRAAGFKVLRFGYDSVLNAPDLVIKRVTDTAEFSPRSRK